MERKYPLTIDRSAENGGDTRETAFQKVDKELDNIIASSEMIRTELDNLSSELNSMDQVDTSSFAKKSELPKIAAGSGVRISVTGVEHKISADIPVASETSAGLMRSVDRAALDGLIDKEPIFTGHLVDPDKHVPEIKEGDEGKILEATPDGAKWITPSVDVGGVVSLNGKSGELTLVGSGVAAVSTSDSAITVTVPEPDWNTLKFRPNIATMFRLGITSYDQVIYPSSALLVIPHAKDTTGTNGNGLIARNEHKKLVWLADNLVAPMLDSASPKEGQVLTVSSVKSTLDGKDTLTYKLADIPTGETPLVLQESHRLLDTPVSAPYAFETAEIQDSVLPRKDALVDVKVWIGEDTVIPLSGILTEASTGQYFPAQYMIGGNAGTWTVTVQNISDPFYTALGELSRNTILGIQVSVRKM